MTDLELDINNEDDLIKIKRIAKGLSDKSRLKIIQLIKEDKYGNLNYGKISEGIERSPTAVTNHMNWLRASTLIEDLIIEGKRGKMQKIPKLKYDKIVIKL